MADQLTPEQREALGGVGITAPSASPRGVVAPLQGSEDEIIARAALAEGGRSPESWRAIAGVIRNRMAHTGLSAAEVLAQPGQFEAYGNGHIQGVDTGAAQYKAALEATRGVRAGDVPYDSFYQPDIVQQRGSTPPFAADHGTRIGTQLFGTVRPEGLTKDQQAAWDAVQPPGPTTPEGRQSTPTQIRDTGFAAPMTVAQQKYLDAHPMEESEGNLGTDKYPYFLAPGRPLPSRPGAVYIDFDGNRHVVPGGALDQAKYYGGALMQGTLMDTAAAANRLTGGGLGVPSAEPGVPMASALAEIQSPGINQATAQGALEGTRQQQNDYGIAHGGDPYASAVRFGGQMIPSTAAAAAFPEIRLAGAAAKGGLGILSRVGSRVLTNAGRGAAATLPTVGTNDAPIPEQLGAGALAGAVLPEVAGAAAKLGARAVGVSATAPPEIAALAKLAREKYGIDLRAGQIAGMTDRNAAIRDSELHSAPGSGVQAGTRQQQRAFTQAASRTIGLDTPNITPEAADTARRNIGSIFEDAANRSGVAADDQLLTDLAKVGSQARELGLDRAQQRALDLQIEKITEAASRYRNGERGIIPGDVFQDWTRHDSTLSRIIDKDHGLFGDLAGDIRGALNDAVGRASPPDVLPMLGQARFQWKNLMTLKPLIANAGPEGMISPNRLRTQVMNKFPNYAFGDGGDLGDLARISHFMKEPPNSGTPARLADMFKGAGNQGALAGLAMGIASHDPGTGLASAALPFALGAGRVTRNALAGWANDNPFARSTLVYGPGQAGGALANFGNTTRPAQVPLSALAVHALAFPAPDQPALPAPVGTDTPAPAYVP